MLWSPGWGTAGRATPEGGTGEGTPDVVPLGPFQASLGKLKRSERAPEAGWVCLGRGHGSGALRWWLGLCRT